MRCTSKDYGPLGVLEYALAVRMRVKRNATPTPRGAGFAGVDYGAMAKRCPEDGAGGRSKHRKTGIDPKWTSDFPWMIVSDGEGEGMMCALCRKHNRRPRKVPVGKAVWVDLPCNRITGSMSQNRQFVLCLYLYCALYHLSIDPLCIEAHARVKRT